MSPDELKSMRKGSFVVMRTGTHPLISKLKLFMKWGIKFDQGKVELADKASRTVHYAGRDSILAAVSKVYPQQKEVRAVNNSAGGTVISEQQPVKIPAKYRQPYSD
jgi:type IV secretion system protein VirD4